MSMRITTGMSMNTYRFNLQKSTKNLSDSRDKVLTGRQFNSYAEDPAAATHAWRIRRSMVKNNTYLNNTSDTYSLISAAYSAMDVVSDKLTIESGIEAAIRGDNGAIGAGRQPLGVELNELAETIIQSMNGAKYGDHFVFSGDDGMNPPFSWSDDMSILYYRGVNVNAGQVEKPGPPAPTWLADAKAERTWTEDDQAWLDYYRHVTDVNPGTADPPKAEPQWFKDIADGAAGTADEAWVKYYQHQGDKPADTEPTLLWDAKAERTWTKNDQAWLDYYNHVTDESPLDKDPTATEPAWFTDKANAATGTDKEWADYYQHKADKPTFPEPTGWAENKYGVPTPTDQQIQDDPNGEAWAAYYRDQTDLKKLEAMANEHTYVDLGMGLKEDEDGNLINGTAFDTSLPGITMMGYGMDKDGDPKNVAMILKKLGGIFMRANPNSGEWGEPGDEADAYRLLNKLGLGKDKLINEYTTIDTKGKFLQENQTRLKDQADTLQEERYNIEMLDPADAITDFMWNYNCFSAALKIGNQLLTQSLIDYMN